VEDINVEVTSEPEEEVQGTEIPDDAVRRARSVSLDGDYEDPTAPSPEEDPAIEGHEEFTLEERTEECVGLATGVIGAGNITVEIATGTQIFESHEVEQLGEVWGKVLRHYMEIQRGTEAGDWSRALGTTLAMYQKNSHKLKQLKQSNDGTRQDDEG